MRQAVTPDQDITPERVRWFADYHAKEPAWGVFHVSLDDGNFECGAADMDGEEHPADVMFMADWFDGLTEDQREELARRVAALEEVRRQDAPSTERLVARELDSMVKEGLVVQVPPRHVKTWTAPAIQAAPRPPDVSDEDWEEIRAYRMSITGKEVLAHGDHELRDLFHARMVELRTKLLEAGAELGAHKLFPPAPHAACDLCGCAVAAAWFRWDDPNAPCYGLACACNGCHDKVRGVTERLLGAARRLSLGAVTELARRLEEGPPAPPRTQEDTERNLGTWCPQCGDGVSVDEDGCCASCGSTATGEGADQASAARLAAGMVAARLGCEVDGPTMLRHIERVVRDGQRKDRTISELMGRLAEVQGHSSIDLDGPRCSMMVADRTLRGAPAECHTPDACEAADACKARDAVCVEDAAWRRWIVTRQGDKRMAYIREGTGSVGDVVQLDWPTKDGLSPAEGWVLLERTQRLVRGPRPHLRRGVEYPCEDCGAVAGSTRDDRGFYRCNRCGYPGQ